MGVPKVTVVMSAYNHEKYVAEAIESVLNQTYKDFLFYVADDASTDNTREIILRYEDQIDEIHLFDENAYGRGYELFTMVKTPYVALISSDDVWEIDKLEKQMVYLETHPECAACFSLVQSINENGEFVSCNIFEAENRSKEEWIKHFFKKGNCLAHPSSVIKTPIRKKLTEENNFGVFRQIPDLYLYLRILQDYEIHIIQEKLIRFRWHIEDANENMSAPTYLNELRHMQEYQYLWLDIIDKMNNDYFVKIFKDELTNKNVKDDVEIICEKFILLVNSKDVGIRQAGILFYQKNMKERSTYNVLVQKYGIDNKLFYEIEQNAGFISEILKKQKYLDEYAAGIKEINQIVVEYEQAEEKRKNEDGYYCNCCREKQIFRPLRMKSTSLNTIYEKRDIRLETCNMFAYSCSSCGSNDTERLILEYIRKEKVIFEGIRLLHISPSDELKRVLLADQIEKTYHTLDINMDTVTYKLDIQNMDDIQDESYDLWICSNALEYAKEDKKALCELNRILKKEGCGLLVTSIDLLLNETEELWRKQKDGNDKEYKEIQRLYSKSDFLDKIERAGFEVFEANREYFGTLLYEEYGFTNTSTLYVVKKRDEK